MLASMMTREVAPVLIFTGTMLLATVCTVVAERQCQFGGMAFAFLGLISGLLALFFLFSPSSIILVKEISPGVFLDQKGKIHYEEIPKNIPAVYELGDPLESGYTIRSCRWIRVVRIDNPYDWRVADVLPITCSVEDVASRLKNIHTVTVSVPADDWWRREHPGKVQGTAAFLVTPRDEGKKARIEKYIFK